MFVVKMTEKCLHWHCMNKTDITDMNNCKHTNSDKRSCKKTVTLKIDYKDKMKNNYQSCYLINTITEFAAAAAE